MIPGLPTYSRPECLEDGINKERFILLISRTVAQQLDSSKPIVNGEQIGTSAPSALGIHGLSLRSQSILSKSSCLCCRNRGSPPTNAN